MRIQAGLHAALDILIESIGCQGDNGDFGGVLAVHGPDPPRRFQAIHFRHAHIHEDRIVVVGGMPGELLHGDPAVFRHIQNDLAHAKYHRHDFYIDRHIFSQQDVPSFQVGAPHLTGCIFLPERIPELIHDTAGKERLRNKGVHAGLRRFIRHIIPVVRSQYNDRRVMADDGTDLPRRLHAVHLRHLPVNEQQVIIPPAGVVQLYHFKRPGAAFRHIAVYSDLSKDHFGVLQGNLVVINYKDAHFTGIHFSVLSDAVPVLRFSQRHIDGERRADALFAFHLYAAIHQLNDALRNRHAEARAPIPVG